MAEQSKPGGGARVGSWYLTHVPGWCRAIVRVGAFVGVPVAVLIFVYYYGKSTNSHDTWAMVFAAVALLLATAVMRLVPVPSQPPPDPSAINAANGQTTPPTAPPSPASRANFLSGLYVGWDGRWSTSKVQALLWTYTIVFALVSLLVASNYGVAPASKKGDLFSNISFDDAYLLLLGGPFAAMVLAKGITSMNTDNGTVSKSTLDDTRTLDQGLRDLIANDAGTTDIGDFQFFAFNLVALAFFYSKFLGHLTEGLPSLPDFLVGLTSTSALAYVGKKSVEKSQATITLVSAHPAIVVTSDSKIGDDAEVTVTGQNLRPGPKASPVVSIGDLTVVPTSVTSDRLVVPLKKDWVVVVSSGNQLAVRVQVSPTTALTGTVGVHQLS